MGKRAKIMKVSDEGTVEWEVEKEEPPVTQSADSKPKLVSIEPKNEICGTPQYRPEPPSPKPVAPVLEATSNIQAAVTTPIQPPAAPKKPSRAEIRKQKDQEKRKKEQIQKMQEARKRKREEAAAKKEQELEEKILQRLMARQQKQRVEYGRQGYQPVPKPQQPPPPPPPSRASSSNYQPEFVAGGRKRGQHNVHYEDDDEEETDMEDESSEEEGQYEAYAQYEDREPKEWKYTSKPLTRESPAARVPKLQNLIFRRV